MGGNGAVPLWLDVALLGEWGQATGRSFAGFELVGDFASRFPVVVIPEIAIGLGIPRVPLRVGAGVPVSIGYGSGDHSVGGLLRLIFEIEPN
jgi:hypothetical protein